MALGGEGTFISRAGQWRLREAGGAEKRTYGVRDPGRLEAPGERDTAAGEGTTHRRDRERVTGRKGYVRWRALGIVWRRRRMGRGRARAGALVSSRSVLTKHLATVFPCPRRLGPLGLPSKTPSPDWENTKDISCWLFLAPPYLTVASCCGQFLLRRFVESSVSLRRPVRLHSASRQPGPLRSPRSSPHAPPPLPPPYSPSVPGAPARARTRPTHTSSTTPAGPATGHGHWLPGPPPIWRLPSPFRFSRPIAGRHQPWAIRPVS